MPKKAAWLAYAEKVKAKVEKLPRNKESLAHRENLVLETLFIARTRHGYPGYLGDWELVLQHANGDQRNGNSTPTRRKRVRGKGVVRQR